MVRRRRTREAPVQQPEPAQVSFEEKKREMALRKIFPEKEYPLSGDAFSQMAGELGISALMRPRLNYNDELVRIYYAAAKSNHDRPNNNNIRGTLVANFTEERIRAHYGLPEVHNCPYERIIRRRQPLPLDEIARIIGKPGTTWSLPQKGTKTIFKRDHMTLTTKKWVHFIATNLLGKTHLSNVTHEQGYLISLLMSGTRVRLEAIIFKTLKKTIESKAVKGNLFFPHLITGLLYSARVREEAEDTLIQVITFDFNKLKTDGDVEEEVNEDTETDEDVATQIEEALPEGEPEDAEASERRDHWDAVAATIHSSAGTPWKDVPEPSTRARASTSAPTLESIYQLITDGQRRQQHFENYVVNALQEIYSFHGKQPPPYPPPEGEQ